MSVNNPQGLGEQPFGNLYEMVAAAQVKQEDNPVTNPVAFNAPPTPKANAFKTDTGILGPGKFSSNRLGYKLLKQKDY